MMMGSSKQPENSQINISSSNFEKYWKEVTQLLQAQNEGSSLLGPDFGYFARRTIIPINENYEEIYSIMAKAFDSNLNKTILLTGSRGNGRSSAVYYAVLKYVEESKRKAQLHQFKDLTNTQLTEIEPLKADKKNSKHLSPELQASPKISNQEEVTFVEVDCLIFKDESKLCNMIIESLRESKHWLTDEELKGANNVYIQITKFAQKSKLVLYFKNIDIYADSSRQVFLYTLFDSINSFSSKIVVVLSANNLFFVNSLEKRVKSRFSHTQFIFESATQENLNMILESRFSIRGNKVFDELSKTFLDLIRMKETQELIAKYLLIGMSIGWIVNVFKTMWIIIGHDQMFKRYSDGTLENHFILKLKESCDMYLYQRGDIDIFNSMTRPAKLVMMTLHSIHNPKTLEGMYYKNFRNKIRELITTKFSSEITRKSWQKFSDVVIRDSLILLKKSGYIDLSKTPITDETSIHLLDNASPTFITIKIDDANIVFSS